MILEKKAKRVFDYLKTKQDGATRAEIQRDLQLAFATVQERLWQLIASELVDYRVGSDYRTLYYFAIRD
ncbi:MAG: hypothetical protein IJM30_09260 [Thermoguttaceae bacterium]|nr:hypothetical protein [Thermoguttaceae bacterium]